MLAQLLANLPAIVALLPQVVQLIGILADVFSGSPVTPPIDPGIALGVSTMGISAQQLVNRNATAHVANQNAVLLEKTASVPVKDQPAAVKAVAAEAKAVS